MIGAYLQFGLVFSRNWNQIKKILLFFKMDSNDRKQQKWKFF